MTTDSFVCVRTKNSFLEATNIEGCQLEHIGHLLSKSSSEGKFKRESRYSWAIGCSRCVPPLEQTDHVHSNDSDSGVARQKRLLPGKKAREAYKDAANRLFEVQAMDDYSEEQIMQMTDSLTPLMQDPSSNQYLHTIMLLKRRHLSATWSLIWRRASDSDASTLAGLYYAWDMTLEEAPNASPRSVIVDFMLLPSYRAPETYAQIGRWIFVQLFGQRSRRMNCDIFRQHGERCTQLCMIPLNTNVKEAACEREVLRRFGFKDLPDCDAEVALIPRIAEWKLRFGLPSEHPNALVETYFDRMAYRPWMCMGPFLWREMELMANDMVQADCFSRFIGKRVINELIPTRKLRRLTRADSAMRISWQPGARAPIYWDADSGVRLRVSVATNHVTTMLEKVEALASSEYLEGIKVVVIGSCSTGVTSTDGVYHCQNVRIEDATSSASVYLETDYFKTAELRFYLNLMPKRDLNDWLDMLTDTRQELFLTIKVSCYAHLPREACVPIFIAKQTLEPEWRLSSC